MNADELFLMVNYYSRNIIFLYSRLYVKLLFSDLGVRARLDNLRLKYKWSARASRLYLYCI